MKRTLGVLTLLTWLSLPWLYWQTQKLRPRQTTLRDFTANATVLGFCGDGRILATTHNHVVTLWDVLAGRKLGELVGHADTVRAVVLSPDGTTAATASDDMTVGIWDLATLTKLRTLHGHVRHVLSVAFSPNGQTLASGSQDARVIVWDAVTGKERFRVAADDRGVLRFSPDGQQLATIVDYTKLKLWNMARGEEAASYEVGAELLAPNFAFSADGRPLYQQQEDGAVTLLDLTTGEQLARCEVGKESFISVYSEGKIWGVIFGGINALTDRAQEWVGAERALRWFPPVMGTIILDATTGRELARLPHYGFAALLPDGKTLTLYVADGDRVELWDLPPRRVVHPLVAAAVLVLALGFSVTWWIKRRSALPPVRTP